MPTYRNTDVETRIWPHISRPDGRTLELAPQERVVLDLPDDFADPHLVSVRPAALDKPFKPEVKTADTTEENKA